LPPTQKISLKSTDNIFELHTDTHTHTRETKVTKKTFRTKLSQQFTRDAQKVIYKKGYLPEYDITQLNKLASY